MTDQQLLKTWRERMGCSQESAARTLGISLRHYQRLERDSVVRGDLWRVALKVLLAGDPQSMTV